MYKLGKYCTGFGMGICAEYLYRVEINPFPIAYLILLTISVVIDCTSKTNE